MLTKTYSWRQTWTKTMYRHMYIHIHSHHWWHMVQLLPELLNDISLRKATLGRPAGQKYARVTILMFWSYVLAMVTHKICMKSQVVRQETTRMISHPENRWVTAKSFKILLAYSKSMWFVLTNITLKLL